MRAQPSNIQRHHSDFLSGPNVIVRRGQLGQPLETVLVADNAPVRATDRFILSTGSACLVDDVNIGHYATEYAYDALGRRIEKRTGGDATRFVYDGAQVVEEWTISGGGSPALAASYVHGLYVDEVLTMRRAASDYYYHGDDMHNVGKLTDSDGDVVEAYDYGDYGQPEFYDATGDLLNVTASPLGNPFLFSGREWDEELGFYYFRYRYMDPGLGRFVSRDPLGLWGDPLNLGNGYTYAASNPWSLVDPLGLESGGNLKKFLRGVARSLWDMGLTVLEADKLMKDPDYLAQRTLEAGEQISDVASAIKDDPPGAAAAVKDAAKDKIEYFGWEDAGYVAPDAVMSIKGGMRSIGALSDVLGNATDLVPDRKPRWRMYEEKYNSEQTVFHTEFEGEERIVRLDNLPSHSTVLDFKDYNWSNSRYNDDFIRQRVVANFQEQIRKYQTIRPNVQFQFSQAPPDWVRKAIEDVGGTYSVQP